MNIFTGRYFFFTFTTKILSITKGPHATMDSVLALHPVALGSILGILLNTSLMFLRFIDGTA